MKTKLHICYKCVGGLGPTPECSLAGGSVYVSPHGPRLVNSVGLLLLFKQSLKLYYEILQIELEEQHRAQQYMFTKPYQLLTVYNIHIYTFSVPRV